MKKQKKSYTTTCNELKSITTTKTTTKENDSSKMNEIKKILMTNDDSDSKINDIHKIVYGCYPQHQ